MKKLLALLLTLVLCLSLAACGGDTTDTATVDTQPAIDAYNELADNYNAFVDQENENLDAWEQEDIDYMNDIADVINQYSEDLSSDKEYTQEEVDEMVDMFTEFNAVIEEYMAQE